VTKWWVGAPPVRNSVVDVCGHEITWRDGELDVSTDVDVESEAVLRALGGESCSCVEAHVAWRALEADLWVLQLGPRHAEDEPRSAILRRHDVLPSAVLHYCRLFDVLQHTGFQRRLVATVAAHWSPLPRTDDEERLLVTAVHGRLLWALRRWTGPGVRLRTELHADAGRPLHLTRAGGGVTAQVGLDWISTVWGRDLAVVGDALVVEVLDVDADQATVSALDRDLRPRTFGVVSAGDGWATP
jgi:hypothetical protein